MKIPMAVLQLLCLVTLASCNEHTGDEASQSVLTGNQFASEDKQYIPGEDKGMGKYAAKSLYGTKKVALTFDDGPTHRHTPKILDLLKDRGVTATFFVMGRNARRNPSIMKRIVEEGHIVALHSESAHANSNTISKEVFEKDITDSLKSVRKRGWTERKELYYRFPYGAYGSNKQEYHQFESLKGLGEKLFNNNCFNFVFWDVDTSDWFLKNPKNVSNGAEKIATTAMAYLDGGQAWDHQVVKKTGGPRTIEPRNEHPDNYKAENQPGVKLKTKRGEPTYSLGGGVILLHDTHSVAVEATEILLNKLEAAQYEIVPLNTVQEYEYQNSKMCNLKEPQY